MTVITSISQPELTQRRKKLRHQRRLKSLQSIWRTVAVSGIAGSMVWVVTLPGWIIARPEQVTIEGNQFLSTQAIQSKLPISYPQSLLQVQPQNLSRQLEAEIPVASIQVTRQLLPPRLIVRIKERAPVAIVTTAPMPLSQSAPKLTQEARSSLKIGLIDESGKWMALENYTAVDRELKLPSLRLIGRREDYAHYWPELYRQLQQSPVKVSEIDWRDPGNLILKTELGIIHFGSYDSRFAEKLDVIDRMRKLSQQVGLSQIAYIDLKNPESPIVQTNQSMEVKKLNNP